jgi:rhamnose transport system ATP-binding protein
MTLRLTDITKSFGAVRALKSVSFELNPGEVHAVVGENGAGKSTLIKIITGAHPPDTGQIHLDGKLHSRLTPGVAHACGIAAIYQQPALFPHLSVAENIGLTIEKPSAVRRVRWKQRIDQATTLLERIGARIDPRAEVRSLSMPEQQLVEIARALGSGARILIMDEPTASLTAREVELLLALVRDLRSQGVGIIYISHRLEEIFQVADRVTVLRDGETIATRPVDSSLTRAQLIHLMVGRDVSPQTSAPPPDSAFSIQRSSVLVPLVELKNITCRASNIRDISLDILAGEVVGLAGLVGAGRTELGRTLFGITPLDSGSISIAGQTVTIRSPRDAVAARIAYLPEDRRRHGVIPEMSVAANISVAILPNLFPNGWMRSQPERELANTYVRELAIKTPSPDTPVANLSGGNQQKVALARWLAAKPKFLILDEPTQGVDVGAKAEIHNLIRQLAANGLAVLMISSELPEILSMSDRIAVMRAGRLTAILDRKTADANTVMAAALGQSR